MEKTLENRRRVKLYVLNAARHWDDRGTGHVSAMYSERLSGMSLIVRDEQSQAMLLESKIDAETSYQKQQETLIVWSENDSDMALSFQEKIGCEEVWAKICSVQGKDPSVEVTQDSLDEEDDDETSASSSMTGYGTGEGNNGGVGGVALPPCEVSKLEKIYEVVQSFMTHPHQRDKLATAIEQEDYIKKLLDLFRQCEDLENTDGLQQLYSIMKSILMLNRNALYEVLFSDECIEDVLGCLEWDPTLGRPKRHRQYIRDVARFKEVVPLESVELQQKIQQMYRVQYIQDVVLPSPSVFEDNVLNTLQSFVFFNKLEIVNMIQEDERFLKALFAQLISPETPMLERRDAILFLKEFCQFSHTLQPAAREGFFRMLMSHGILQAVQAALDVPDQKMRSAIVDVFTYIVELHPFVVREFSMTQAVKESDDSKLFFVRIIRQAVVHDPDPQAAGAMQILAIMRLLLDPENMLSSPNKNEKTEFLSFFYKRCIPYLVEPILEVTRQGTEKGTEKGEGKGEGKGTEKGQGEGTGKGEGVGEGAGKGVFPKREDIRTVHILNLILEFLSYCVEHHTFHIKNFIIGRDLLTPVLLLLQSSHQFLVVAVIRFLRKIIGLNEDFYNRYIVKGDHLKPVIETFLKNGRRYNLLNSAILELFEHIRADDIRLLINYVISSYWDRLNTVTYSNIFSLLHLRHGVHISLAESSSRLSVDRPNTPNTPNTPNAPNTSSTGEGVVRSGGTKRFRRDEREMDEDEEHWFDENDEVEESEGGAMATGGDGSEEGVGSADSSTSPKLTLLTSVKSLPHVNTAPPVKRPNLDDMDDDDNPFGGVGSPWSKSNSRLNRKIARTSPSPAFKVSISASADSTREVGDSSPTSNGPGSPVTNSPPTTNHISSPSSTLPWEASLYSGGGDLTTTPTSPTSPTSPTTPMKSLPSLGKQSALLAASSPTNHKPPSPALVCYPDDEEEEDEGMGNGSGGSNNGSGDAGANAANPLERQEVTS